MHKHQAAVAIAATALAVTGSGAATSALAASRDAMAATTLPTVVAHMSASHIRLSTGSSLHAGRVLFRVVTGSGDHTLQIARLHKGYTMQQAFQDINKSFQGDVPAIRRVDHNITFRGGAEARPQKPGMFSTTLAKGRYLLLDQNGNATTMLNVYGATPARPQVAHSSFITTFSYGFGTSASMPHQGWTHVTNRSDQPHFVVFDHVKQGTTHAMVRRYFKSGGQGHPSFALRANTTMGVISPYRGEVLHYNLPAGEYLIACFWPDDDSGMPHAFMGMWKLVQLR